MSCPFLKETSIRYCHGSPLRKLIAAGNGTSSICSSPGHVDCAVYRERVAQPQPAAQCPYLHESLAHYCGAASVTRFIPFSQQSGRCGGDGYRFCDLYLSLSRPQIPDPNTVPGDLFYASNHLWLHSGPNGACHVGIDGFFASILGHVDRITIMTTSGVQRPSAVLTVRGIDWPVTFPNALVISGANLYLRSHPERLTADPFGSGWLFEGWESPGANLRHGLIGGKRAVEWMARERLRLDHTIHDLSAQHGYVNDGGSASRDLFAHLGREEILHLLNVFFAPHRLWTDD
jgi:glycine cleavage system H lipoate-binding protein